MAISDEIPNIQEYVDKKLQMNNWTLDKLYEHTVKRLINQAFAAGLYENHIKNSKKHKDGECKCDKEQLLQRLQLRIAGRIRILIEVEKRKEERGNN